MSDRKTFLGIVLNSSSLLDASASKEPYRPMDQNRETIESSGSDDDAEQVPLVVDLDGTLVRSDLLHEGFLELLVHQPLEALKSLVALKHGRAAFKSRLAQRVSHNVDLLPLNSAVLEAMQSARKCGRRVYLATAADRKWAQSLADKLVAFDGVFASEGGLNLKGDTKARALCEAFGENNFDYIGNSRDDLPVWKACRRPFIAGASASKARRLARRIPKLSNLGSAGSSWRAQVRALRPHQWSKNALVALPVIAGHVVSPDTALAVFTAFISFCLCASSVYILNDMLDLAHDRSHVEKRHRPIAAGLMPISHGVALLVLLAVAAFGLSLLLPTLFMIALAAYATLAIAYALLLKRKLMIDVVTLASLFGIRVMAGAAAATVKLSDWLVAFCFFLFLCLALVKRSTELGDLPEGAAAVKGRGYRKSDLSVIGALTAASGLVSVLVLALYINSPEVELLYRRPEVLWGVLLLLVYWLGRVIVLTARREMTLDPIVFAFRDRISLLTGLLVLAIVVLAA